jgi:hypothetical protein
MKQNKILIQLEISEFDENHQINWCDTRGDLRHCFPGKVTVVQSDN